MPTIIAQMQKGYAFFIKLINIFPQLTQNNQITHTKVQKAVIEIVIENMYIYYFKRFVAEKCKSTRIPYSKGRLYLQVRTINKVRKSATLHVPVKRINSRVTHVLLNLKDEIEANYPEFEVSISPRLSSEKSWDVSVKNMDVYTIQNTGKKR